MTLVGVEHGHLAERYLALHRSRARHPIFAIEHGLGGEDLNDLRHQVAAHLSARPSLQDPWWLQNYLPLLVVATEVGYRYRGTGTDFWPILTVEMRTEDGHAFRQGLTRMFELGHRDHHLARPGQSAWERHFPYIAWPIGNAGVPIELHRYLAASLRQAVRDGMYGEQSDELLTYLQSLAAGWTSRRFESWLGRRDLAMEVIRRLLVPEEGGWLDDAFVARLDVDLKSDRQTRRAIGEARRTASQGVARLPTVPRARFVLELVDLEPTALLVRGPALGRQDREELISTLRIPWDKLRAGRRGSSIDLAHFLTGGEVEVGSIEDMRDDVLVRGDNATGPTGAASSLLQRLQPLISDFFRVEGNGRWAETAFPGDVLDHEARVIQLLRTQTGEGRKCRLLLAASDAAILKKHGFEMATVASPFRVAGLPMSGVALAFASGFPVLVRARRDAVVPMLDGELHSASSISFAGGEWHVFFPEEGDHEVTADDEDGGVEFSVVEPPDIDPARIRISPEMPSLRDFETGILSILANAPLPLEDLDLKVTLFLSTGGVLTAETRIRRLPMVLGGNAPVIQGLRKQLAELTEATHEARLVVEIRGFAPFEMWLRSPADNIRFDAERGAWGDIAEEKIWPSLFATSSHPLPASNEDEGADVVLHLPDAPDHEALSVGFVTSNESSIRLGDILETPISIPKVRREDTGDGLEAGGGDLVRAYLAWKLAAANGWVADFRRRAVETGLEREVVGLFCGQEWVALEDGLDLSILTPQGALHRSALRHGLLTGGDLPHLSEPADKVFLRDRLGERFRRLVSDPRTALENLDDDFAGDLDFAVIEAYEDLRKELERKGRDPFDEVDVYFEPDQWRDALVGAVDITFLTEFKRFILPEKRWQHLANAWYDDVSDSDLIDLLVESHVDASRRSGFRWIGQPELRTMLQLWLSPGEVFRSETWRAALARGHSDRQTARAVRYVALRRKLTMSDLPAGDFRD